jgi:predicted methyltransferase
MSRLTAFFHDADTEFAVFYPRGYLLAVFPNLPDADRAMQDFHDAGREDDEMISVSGVEALQFAEDHLINGGLWGALMTQLSRVIGTEAAYADDDLKAARNGAAFLAVHCPTDRLRAHAWSVLKASKPLAARHYSARGIESLPAEGLGPAAA